MLRACTTFLSTTSGLRSPTGRITGTTDGTTELLRVSWGRGGGRNGAGGGGGRFGEVGGR